MPLSHLECSRTGKSSSIERLRNLSEAGAPLLARYDFSRGARLDRAGLKERPFDMWRYREVLPLAEDGVPVSLGAGILACPEGGACLAALEALVQKRWLTADETVVLFNTASGLKYS